MPSKYHTQVETFQCPKWGQTARLEFRYREDYVNESPEPVSRSLDRFDCSGRLYCGITPQSRPGAWGKSDWTVCAYPNLKSKGVRNA